MSEECDVGQNVLFGTDHNPRGTDPYLFGTDPYLVHGTDHYLTKMEVSILLDFFCNVGSLAAPSDHRGGHGIDHNLAQMEVSILLGFFHIYPYI